MRYGKRQRPRRRPWLRSQMFVWTCALVIIIGVFVYMLIPDKETPLQKTEATATFVATLETPEIFPTHTATLAAQEQETPPPEVDPEFINLGEFSLTAYCPCVKCCEIWSAEHPSRIGTDYIQKTASGTIPTAGRTIATDITVIPFGTVVYINGHEYVAEDKGGAVKGNHIDVFFSTHREARDFGRQTAEVTIKNLNHKGEIYHG